MSKLVILDIGKGNFEQGFQVSLEIFTEEHQLLKRTTGDLPAAPDIPIIFHQWQEAYRSLDMNYRSSFLEAPESQITNISITEKTQNSDRITLELQKSLNNWYSSKGFKKIREALLANLSISDNIRIVIRTHEAFLWQLPWHLFFEPFLNDFRQTEVALTLQEYTRVNTAIASSPAVKLLAIIGDSTGINTEIDRQQLEALPHAAPEFLVEPQKVELGDRLWSQDWQVLFFAGHSTSQGEAGRLFINQTECLTIAELKHALENAISSGLQLAIFNSCDGLQLAKDLAELQIPQMIVMREPVPDRIAQDFLKYFLASYTKGESLYVAVRRARERLKDDNKFPCASWMPVIFQNPAEIPPTWEELRLGRKAKLIIPPIPKPIATWKIAIATSIFVTGLLMGLRQLGVLEYAELKSFDQMVRLKPDEGTDPRLLVVMITEEDIQSLKRASPSDRQLIDILKKLDAHKPHVIGLDVFRDDPIKLADVPRYYTQNDGLVMVCQVSDRNDRGVVAPNGFPVERQGFSDLLPDPIDNVVRRQLLTLTPPANSPCRTDTSLSLLVARYHLAAQGIQPPNKEYLQLGNVTFYPFGGNTGGYVSPDIKGFQILINWRSPQNVARQITLTQVIKGEFDPSWVKDKVVLIGYEAKSKHDYSSTPYSAGQRPYQEMPGVLIHAQMTSQILAAVLDGRPLLQPIPIWEEILWILVWSAAGGFVAIANRRILLVIGGIAIAVALPVGSYFLFVAGWWVPLVPALCGAIGTGGSVVFWRWRSQRANPWYKQLQQQV